MRAVRVVLADGGLGIRAEILDVAERCGFEVVGEAVEWDDVVSLIDTRAADLVLVAGPADYAGSLSRLDGTVATLAFAPSAITAKEFTSCGATAIVTVDCDPDFLMATVQVALATTRKLVSVRSEREQLRDQLETRKVVERAKGVLMQRLGIDEGAAYKRMQRASQEENRKMREIAESILSAERLYSEPPKEPL